MRPAPAPPFRTLLRHCVKLLAYTVDALKRARTTRTEGDTGPDYGREVGQPIAQDDTGRALTHGGDASHSERTKEGC